MLGNKGRTTDHDCDIMNVLQAYEAETGGEPRHPASERGAAQVEEGAGRGRLAVRGRGGGARHAAAASQAMIVICHVMLINVFIIHHLYIILKATLLHRYI